MNETVGPFWSTLRHANVMMCCPEMRHARQQDLKWSVDQLNRGLVRKLSGHEFVVDQNLGMMG